MELIHISIFLIILGLFPPLEDTRKTKEKYNKTFIFVSILFYCMFLYDSIKNRKGLETGVSTYMLLQSLKNTIDYFRDE